MQQFGYTIVNENGKVLSSGQTNVMELTTDIAGATVIMQLAPENTYWNGTKFIELKSFSAENTVSTTWAGTGEFVIGDNLPNPTGVLATCSNSEWSPNSIEYVQVTDGTLNVTSEVPGTYKFLLYADQYYEQEFEIVKTS